MTNVVHVAAHGFVSNAVSANGDKPFVLPLMVPVAIS